MNVAASVKSWNEFFVAERDFLEYEEPSDDEASAAAVLRTDMLTNPAAGSGSGMSGNRHTVDVELPTVKCSGRLKKATAEAKAADDMPQAKAASRRDAKRGKSTQQDADDDTPMRVAVVSQESEPQADGANDDYPQHDTAVERKMQLDVLERLLVGDERSEDADCLRPKRIEVLARDPAGLLRLEAHISAPKI